MCGCNRGDFCISVCPGHLEKNFKQRFSNQPSSTRATIIRQVIFVFKKLIPNPTFIEELVTRPLELRVSTLPGAIAWPSQQDSDSEFNPSRQEVNMTYILII